MLSPNWPPVCQHFLPNLTSDTVFPRTVIIWLAANRVDIKGAFPWRLLSNHNLRPADRSGARGEGSGEAASSFSTGFSRSRCALPHQLLERRATIHCVKRRQHDVLSYTHGHESSSCTGVPFRRCVLPLGFLTPSNTQLKVPVLFLVTLAIIQNISPQILLLLPIMPPSRF